MTRYTYFAMCARGLEPVLHQEIKDLRFGKVERQTGGVRFEGTIGDGWKANLWLRTAGKVLLRLERFPAASSDSLHSGILRMPWEEWLAPEGTLRVDAQTTDSALDHSRFIEQRVKDAICDRFREREGVRPSVGGEDADLRVHLHLFRDRATVSVDMSGAPLRKRGWRVDRAQAPLAETLAAGLVLGSGWGGKSPLIDPFCGSGTILVEAGLIATNTAPGLGREIFGFERWPNHDARAYERQRAKAEAERRPLGKVQLVGADREPARVEETLANLEAAGLRGQVEPGDARHFAPRAGWNGTVVSNLPYGKRVGSDAEVIPLHRDFGARLRENCSGYSVALLTAAGQLAGSLGIPNARRVPLANGGIECERVMADLD